MAALAFGDDTARRAGRLTLNPVAHVDPFGTLLLPVLMGQDLIGVVRMTVPLGVRVEPARIEDAVRYIRTITSILTNSYQLNRSRELALRDDLTRAFNRRFFESYLNEEMERARRYKSALSIIFLDLDDLKLVALVQNDATGEVLQAVQVDLK